MDKEKIIRLIDEANDIVSALYRQGANKDYKCKSLREKLNAITEEISSHPKSNADRIRQMTDEELADFIETITNCCFDRSDCNNCPMKYPEKRYYGCNIKEWIKQELKYDKS